MYPVSSIARLAPRQTSGGAASGQIAEASRQTCVNALAAHLTASASLHQALLAPQHWDIWDRIEVGERCRELSTDFLR